MDGVTWQGTNQHKKPSTFLCINDETVEKETVKAIPFTAAT